MTQTYRTPTDTETSRTSSASGGRLLAAPVVIPALLLVAACSGSGPTAPSVAPAPQRSVQIVRTPQGDVHVYHDDSLSLIDQAAVEDEVIDGYTRATRQVGAANTVGTDTFHITTFGLEPGLAGSYHSGEIKTARDWRAVDHELQHHFCHALSPPGVNCRLVDHCEGTDLAGVPLSTLPNCS